MDELDLTAAESKESLAQSYDSYTPVWDDYKEDKKNALEKVFRTVEKDNVEKIKGILIKDGHLKSSKRFQEFVAGYIGEDFFNYNEKRKIVGKEEFQIALVNAQRTSIWKNKNAFKKGRR